MFHVKHQRGLIGELVEAVTANDDLDQRFDTIMSTVPRETSGAAMVDIPAVITPPHAMPYPVVALLQATITEAWLDYGGDPNNPEQFWNHLVGNGAADVPRETSIRVDVLYRVNGGAVRTAQRTVEATDWFHAVDKVKEQLTSALSKDNVEFVNFKGGCST